MRIIESGSFSKTAKKSLIYVIKSSSYLRVAEEDLSGACWEGYEAIGKKKKNGKDVPNCVPKDKKEAAATVVSPIDSSRFPDRSKQGLEGPFRQPTGHVLYYDPKEGKYYDPTTDMYVSDEEYAAMQRR